MSYSATHFVCWHLNYKAVIDISNFSVLAGKLPPKAMALVIEWASIYQKELIQEWDACKNGTHFKIKPLE
ncbi:MAG: DUF4160 domain-containing protein [Oligoflexia bacterium]|nr:DUF4160 domain-containing protein [Oligoflexia bacterium]